jgi:hypothetical protein
MKQLYYSQIYPYLIGSIAIWGTQDKQKTYLQPLIRIQRKIIRLLKNKPPRSHTKPLMNELNILNITNLYTLRVCIEMHPFIYPPTPTHRPEHNHTYLWTSQIHDYPTRYSKQLHHFIPNPYKYSETIQPKHTTDHYTAIYSNVWNSIPTTVREIQNINKFKSELRKHLQAKQASDE